MNVSKSFEVNGRALTVLDQINLTIGEGESCAVVGPSGSGKTTLLGLFAGLDLPTSGSVELFGNQLQQFSEDERAKIRRESVGFVFQTFRLFPTLTALENVLIPAELSGTSDAREQAHSLLDAVGLADRVTHYPAQLSGGEQQRVALARAFINTPRILFADEPTGNLDAVTGAAVEDMLFELNKAASTTLVLITHDNRLAAKADRVIELSAGRVIGDSRPSGTQDWLAI